MMCTLTDCDCNVLGTCVDNYAHVNKFRFSSCISDPQDCMSYNPVDKEDDSGAPFWD